MLIFLNRFVFHCGHVSAFLQFLYTNYCIMNLQMRLINNFLYSSPDLDTYNAITPNNCFIKGTHKYDVYLVEENKANRN